MLHFQQTLYKRPAAEPPTLATSGPGSVGGPELAPPIAPLVGAKKPAPLAPVTAGLVSARGAPPPVPPNKPVVPPKKDVGVAFLRRAEHQQAIHGASTDAPSKHFVKQNTVIANPAAQNLQQTDDEVSPCLQFY